MIELGCKTFKRAVFVLVEPACMGGELVHDFWITDFNEPVVPMVLIPDSRITLGSSG